MAAWNTPLEENLKCSVCLDIFKDPVVLHCSHSFCKACLDNIWSQKEVKECPLCRKASKRAPLHSIALKNACESFTEEKRRRISTSTQGVVCLDHAEKHQLFCNTDQKLVCMQCLDRDHKDHNFSTISNEASNRRTQLQKPLKVLQDSLKVLASKKSEYGLISAGLKSVAQQTEKQIREEFKKLHDFLKEEEEARITILKKEEKEKIQRINEQIKEVEALCTSLSEQIKKIQDDMTSDDSLFLHNLGDTEKRAQYTVPTLKMDLYVLINVAKHMGNLRYSVWEKMKDICPYYPVILDPRTKNANLQLCKDLISVSVGPVPPTSPAKSIPVILGSEGFTSTHSWEVEVGNNEQWTIGVIKRSAEGLKEDCSLLSLHKGKASWSPTAPKLTRVRVFLDSEKGQVLFTDPVTNTTLQTHPHTFTEKLYPCFRTFSQVPLRIRPATVSVSVSSL